MHRMPIDAWRGKGTYGMRFVPVCLAQVMDEAISSSVLALKPGAIFIQYNTVSKMMIKHSAIIPFAFDLGKKHTSGIASALCNLVIKVPRFIPGKEVIPCFSLLKNLSGTSTILHL